MESGTGRDGAARRLSRRIAAGVMAMALVVALGWVLDVGILKSLAPGHISMKVNTALGLFLAGWGVFLMGRRGPERAHGALVCASVILALGAASGLQHTTGIDLGMDQLLAEDAREDLNPGRPGRMAPVTSFNLMLVGLAILCLSSSRRSLQLAGQALIVTVAVASLVAMTAYVLEVRLPLPGYSQMALHTAAGFFALCVAMLCVRPELGFMEVVNADHAGGAATRRLLPIVVVVPLVIGWLRLKGQRAGLYESATGTLLFTCAVVVSLAVLVWWDGRAFGRADTERRRAEEELRLSETRWRQIADAMPQIVWSASAEGWIDYFNQRWVEYARLTPGLPVAHQLVAAMHPGEVEAVLDGWREAVDQGLRYEGQLRFRRASDGEYRWHLARALPVRDGSGEITRWYGTCTDIEDQKAATEAAERANRAKSEFLANMSHEIRTPMNGIIGLTELLMATPLSRVQHDYMSMVGDSAERLLSVINGILDFSKIESGGLELEARPFDLRETVAEAVRSVGVSADGKGLEVSFRVAPDVPAQVIGDDGRFRQVLLNLLSNAVKFTGRGHVVLDLEKEWEQAGEVALHGVVRDTGIGIPPERREAIFQPFVQADGSSTREYGGTGLGLTISSQIVALMGGAIWVESEVGRGSAFHFRVRMELAAAPAAPAGDASLLAGLRVLVADDLAINHRILDEMLRSWGCIPTVVASGEEALAALAEEGPGPPYRMVLLDTRMSGLDGFAVAERIRARAGPAPALVMMLASSGHAVEAIRCHELGGLPYVVKPVVASQLRDALLAVLAPPLSARADAGEAPRAAGRPLKVLVAEDNNVNRRLVLALLTGMGHQVTLVYNGREAVEAARTGQFDLALLDVHMPEMDGFEATAEIRALERTSARHLPIAAVTARAQKGDREACLAAGMDDYLPKPIRAPALQDLLDRWTAHTPAAPAASPFDPEDVMARVEGDRELLAELVEIFRAEHPRLLAELRRCVEAGDARGAQDAAHAIKGTVGNFGGHAASEAARAIEALGERSLLADAMAVDRLERAVSDLERDLVVMTAAGA